jgi:hypothetical protein
VQKSTARKAQRRNIYKSIWKCKKMRYKYIVEGLKYFDKKHGNTYHAVKITDTKTKETIFRSGLSYGYGDHWKQTALLGLIRLKLWSDKDRHNHELKKELIYFTCYDTTKIKDLMELA